MRMGRMVKFGLAVAVSLSTLLPVRPSWAATFTVNDLGEGVDLVPGDGDCDSDAASAGEQCTLAAAIMETNALDGADVIEFSVTGTIAFSAQRVIQDELTIVGPGPGQLSLDGQGSTSLLRGTYQAANTPEPPLVVNISGLTMTGASGSSGVAYYALSNVSTTFEDVVFSQNDSSVGNAFTGGTIYVFGPQLTVRNGVFDSNSGDLAGIFGQKNGEQDLTVTVDNCTFLGNESTSTVRGGGAITMSNADHHLIVRDSLFVGNTSVEQGGAIDRTGAGTLIIERSAFFDNQGTNDVGAVYALGMTEGRIVNSTFSNNSGAIAGALLVNADGFLDLANLTVVGNQTVDGPGGVWAGGTVQVQNSVIAQNTSENEGPDCKVSDETVSSLGHNFVGSNEACPMFTQTGDQIGDVLGGGEALLPELDMVTTVAGQPRYFVPLAQSPLVDAGDPEGCRADDDLDVGTERVQLTIDQRSEPRPVDGGSGQPRCDIGAIELQTEAEPGGPGGAGGAGADGSLQPTGRAGAGQDGVGGPSGTAGLGGAAGGDLAGSGEGCSCSAAGTRGARAPTWWALLLLGLVGSRSWLRRPFR